MKLDTLSVAVKLAVTLIPLATLAAGTERRQLDAHEHGVTTLNMALDDDILALELEGPAMNFVGFEHLPRTPEQQQAIAETLDIINGGSQLFQPDPDADCTLIEASGRHFTDADDHDDHGDEHDDHDDGHDEHGEDHDEHEAESRHSEFVGQFRYRCDKPGKLLELRVTLFERFPLTTEVEASFIGPEGQTFEALTAADPVIRLRP
ncbi:MAG: DUF2796 domain-containing protein [Gammaproteobacteria bacterium]|nr:DUF2796 domain-containing protein [Gammaproteobacteria bacterium]